MVYHALKTTLTSGAGVMAEEIIVSESTETVPVAVAEPEIYQIPAVSQPAGLPIREFTPVYQNPVATTLSPEPSPVQPQLLKINDLERARLIGPLFDTYILMELDQELLLIDQHAAHEKILFEELLARHQLARAAHAAPSAQTLLVPQIIEVSRREMQFLHSEQDKFLQLGFEYDVFGSSEIALRSYPDSGRHALQPEQAFRMTLDTLLADNLDTDDKIADYYYSMACKAAVKAADRLKPQEIERLLADLQQLENPYQCPHGRPVVVRLTKYELEKRFKRIV